MQNRSGQGSLLVFLKHALTPSHLQVMSSVKEEDRCECGKTKDAKGESAAASESAGRG